MKVKPGYRSPRDPSAPVAPAAAPAAASGSSDAAPALQRKVASLCFSLRGVGLAAMDKKRIGKGTGSSDPYFLLKAPTADGRLFELARSNTVMKNVNPSWGVVEVDGARLSAWTHMRIEVYDYDAISKNDQIGGADVPLPVLERLAVGRHELQLRAMALTDAKGKADRGTVEGSVTVLIRSAHDGDHHHLHRHHHTDKVARSQADPPPLVALEGRHTPHAQQPVEPGVSSLVVVTLDDVRACDERWRRELDANDALLEGLAADLAAVPG